MEASNCGPRVVMDGPLPRPPRFNLLTVAIEGGDVLDGDGSVTERWGNGVQLYPYPGDLPGGFDPEATGTLRVKDEGNPVPLPSFNAFTAYQPIKCTAAGVDSDTAFRARAVAALAATEAWSAERQLAMGDPMDDNPYLGDTNADVLSGTAETPLKALRLLEQAIAETGKAGVIHMGVGLATHLGDILWRDGTTMRSPVGTPIAVGYGYEDAYPIDVGAPGDADHVWAFATGPVIYKLGVPFVNPQTIREALDRSNNDLVYRAERDVLVVWDTLLQAAVRADLG